SATASSVRRGTTFATPDVSPTRRRTSPARRAVCPSSSSATPTVSCAPSSTSAAIAAPRADEAELGELRLFPLRLESWGQFLFVNADPDAAALAIDVRLPFDPEQLVFRERVDYALAANWKIAVENYLECYHCPVAHPDFSKLVDVDPKQYELRAARGLWSQYGHAREGEGRCEFHLVWPGLKLNVYPGLVNLSIGPVWPDGPDRTVGFLD